MYFKDLSPYSYLAGKLEPNVLTIGWLDAEHDFTRGQVPPRILTQILELCARPVNRTRGFHESEFLDPPPFGYPVECNGKQLLLGSAEIRVPGKGGLCYAAPDLIYHYIKDCNYLPPEEFLAALDALVSAQRS